MFYTYVNQVGNDIIHRWYDPDSGKRHIAREGFEPTLYVPTTGVAKFRGIRGEKLEEMTFDNVQQARNFIKEHNDISNFAVHGNTNYWAQFINKTYASDIKWDMVGIVVANLDIETLINDPDNPGLNPIENPIEGVNRITAITVEVNGEYTVFGSKPYPSKKLPLNAKHIYCESEGKLLYEFLDYWVDLDPDIVTGWNIQYFDIPYLIGRIRKVLGNAAVADLAGRCATLVKNPITVREYTNDDGKTGVEVAIMGVSIMDYMVMYKKFTYKMRERYSLDHIAEVELSENKIEYKDEYGNLDGLYERNYQLYIDYNIKDVELIRRLDNKLNLMMLIMTLTYMCGIRHEDVFSQVRMWDTLIFNKLMRSNVIVPPKAEFSKDQKYEGAYVREPEIGMHEWVVSFDLNSLYPHLIMQYNISPEKLVNRPMDEHVMFGIDQLVNGTADLDFLKDEDLSMTANKAFFKKDSQGFLAQMMDDLYAQRKVVKKDMLEAESDVELIKSMLKERGAL